ncbi:MAG: RNA-guided pseudouridylation complex pseudouridine synthase subunit Cbf5 [Nanoarchaeota archaeon]|nr:RNA-guided pseudouridylation complex pseudouridine synthase subunit Cbf5 [Nanoarchaeota archaeon]MBU1597275.1 RNA-guided pseudouridylation complex pseudouridine synthase subunit Cbf5 [Nanoarchaeota archaeon]MBU2440803.1 RNA-guided pseudouridylation complex pseudouridine synthase subunit Cbf5 [Nanoarchaeota archaeon]
MANEFPWMIKRKVLVKKESGTNPEFGCRPEERSTEALLDFGIVNIDKPSGPSSHQVSAYVKNILHVNKAGHSGTLDPKVTGSLPVAIGKGTRIVQSLLTAGKEYVCLMQIHADVDEEKLKKTIKKYIGVIDQLPPVRSAVKRQQRKRTIYYIEIIEIKAREVLFRVGCQAGTYIRKICSDIGNDLGTGAHMAELRRTMAGPFDESTLCTLQDLTDAYHYYKEKKDDSMLRKLVQPFESGAMHLAKVWVVDGTVHTLCHGAYLNVPGIAKIESGILEGDRVAVMTLKDELVSVGKAMMSSEQVIKKNKGLFLKPDQVFMDSGVYKSIK